MERLDDSGLWELFIPGLDAGTLYKYALGTADGSVVMKCDPYAFYGELRPKTASVVSVLDGYVWGDAAWQARKAQESPYGKPINIYEVHIGSWRRNADGSFLTYRELAETLPRYAADMGYTHLELMPISEHPFDGSWGYQVTGYYAVTSRYGSPEDFMYFVDCCHQQGLGVLLDWVPGHFPKDAHGLARFDGTALYEHADPRQGEHPQWGTLIFNYDRNEVQSFLVSNALFWMDVYHVDGLRVDAVASMLYLDFAREDWIPNIHGGRENLGAIAFMKKLNEAVYREYPNTLMIAEESSEWPMVTRPTYLGGLGYNYKWNMGWMNDILKYSSMDSIHRKWHHHLITFSMMYAFSENFILPLSHDEVVHGKCSLLNRMPGDYWQKFAGLRALYGYMAAHPGKKLLFMGSEYGQFIEWQYDDSLDWHLLDYEMHGKMHQFVRLLNHFYLDTPALWEVDHNWDGFQWIDPHDHLQSVVSFVRWGKDRKAFLVAVVNFTPVAHGEYRLGVPEADGYMEVLNSDDPQFGGSGLIYQAVRPVEAFRWHSFDHSIRVMVPPLAAVYYRPVFYDTKE
jgi:1,4-alpha-glucan branching enzyme